MKRGWLLMAAVPVAILVVFLILVMLPSGDGRGQAQQVEDLFYQAVQSYEAMEGAEVHWTLTHVSKAGSAIQNDAVLWLHGENWLQETKVLAQDGYRVITQLQYGDLLLTDYGDTVTCQNTVLQGVGQVTYQGFDTWERTESGGWMIFWEKKADGGKEQRGACLWKGSMELDREGNLVRILTQEYYAEQQGHLEKEFTVVHRKADVCEETIEHAYQRLKAAAEAP